MMHSNLSNNSPLDSSSSSYNNCMPCSDSVNVQRQRISVRRASLTLVMEDGSCQDVSNLSLKANTPLKELYPQRESVRCLHELDDSHTARLWESRPRPKPRSEPEASTTDSNVNVHINKNNERLTPRRQTTAAATRRPSIVETPGPQSPLVLPPSMSQLSLNVPQPVLTPTPAPVPTPAPAAAQPITNGPVQPGPRPKVNYKALYGGSGDSARSVKSRTRHMSFQEQQLQRTLEEERLRQQDPDEQQQQEEPVPPPPAPQQPRQEPPALISRQQTPPPPLMSMPPPCAPAPVVRREPLPTQVQVHVPKIPTPPSSNGSSVTTTTTSKTVMEIAPNLFVPYKGSHQTWEAVQRGQFTVTTCFACTLQLVVIDTAEFLVCPDCHTVSPLSYSTNDGGVERCGVGLGIKREWCDTEAALPRDQHTNNNHTDEVLASAPVPQPLPYKEDNDYSKEKHEKYYNGRDHSPEHCSAFDESAQPQPVATYRF